MKFNYSIGLSQKEKDELQKLDFVDLFSEALFELNCEEIIIIIDGMDGKINKGGDL